jgi:hypothetical protein
MRRFFPIGGPFWRGYWTAVLVNSASTLYFSWIMGVIGP